MQAEIFIHQKSYKEATSAMNQASTNLDYFKSQLTPWLQNGTMYSYKEYQQWGKDIEQMKKLPEQMRATTEQMQEMQNRLRKIPNG